MSQSTHFPTLHGHTYINLTTYRKSGAAVTTPVWFAQHGDRLFIYTGAEAGKIKRIRNNSKVEIGPCTARGQALGPTSVALARILHDPGEQTLAEQVLNAKYGWQKKLINLVRKVRGGTAAYIEIMADEL